MKSMILKFLSFLCAVSFLLVLLLGSLLLLSTTPDVMEGRFRVCAEEETIAPLAQSYGDIAYMTTQYLKGKTGEFQYTFTWEGSTYHAFKENEQRHMADVRRLFALADKVTVILDGIAMAGIVFFLLKGEKAMLCKAYLRAAPILTAVLLAIAAFAVIDFDGLFVMFHRLLFQNELWLLDPATDCLILLMPTSFFITYAAIVLGLFLVLAVIIWLIVFFISRQSGSISLPSRRRHGSGV